MNLRSKSSDAGKVLTEESDAPNKHSHNSFNDLHEQVIAEFAQGRYCLMHLVRREKGGGLL